MDLLIPSPKPPGEMTSEELLAYCKRLVNWKQELQKEEYRRDLPKIKRAASAFPRLVELEGKDAATVARGLGISMGIVKQREKINDSPFLQVRWGTVVGL